jgi:hypothetical protein
MNDTRNSIQIPAEESSQAEVPYHLVSYNIPCILRRGDIASDKVYPPPVMDASGIDWGLERKFDWEPHDGKRRSILQVLRQMLIKPLKLLNRKAPGF